jgi:hypothetical protein
MSTKQAKTVSITKAVQTNKTDTETIKQVDLTKGLTAAKSGKSQVANKPLTAMETSAVNVEEQDTELVILLDKYTVEAHFLNDVEGQLLDIYSSLLDDVAYSPAEIVGEMFWANLSSMGQRLAILCLKHLAAEPNVPLADVTCERCGITSFAVV